MIFELKNIKKTVSYLLVCSILASCSTSNQVISNKLFQKRKYQKGWHVNSAKSYKKDKSKENHTSYDEVKDIAIAINQKKEVAIVKKEVMVNRFFQIQRFTNKKLLAVIKKSPLVKKRLVESVVNIDFNRVESITKTDKVINPPIDRTGAINRFFLVLLALGIIFYFQLSPLAILIAVGKVESFKTNLILWLVGVMILAIALFIAFLSILFTPVVIVMLVIGGLFILLAHVHAIFVIFRRY